MADGLTTGTHIEYTRCSGFALSLLPDPPPLPNFYFAIFARALPLSKDHFGTPIQIRIPGDGAAGKQNTPGCLNQTQTNQGKNQCLKEQGSTGE